MKLRVKYSLMFGLHKGFSPCTQYLNCFSFELPILVHSIILSQLVVSLPYLPQQWETIGYLSCTSPFENSEMSHFIVFFPGECLLSICYKNESLQYLFPMCETEIPCRHTRSITVLRHNRYSNLTIDVVYIWINTARAIYYKQSRKIPFSVCRHCSVKSQHTSYHSSIDLVTEFWDKVNNLISNVVTETEMEKLILKC